MERVYFEKNKYFDFGTRRLHVDNHLKESSLSGIPFRILHYLAKNSPNYLTEDQIRNACWNNEGYAGGSLAGHIKTIRKYIEDVKIPGQRTYTYITTSDGNYACSVGIVNDDADSPEHDAECFTAAHTPNEPFSMFMARKNKTYEQYVQLLMENIHVIKSLRIVTYAGSTWLTTGHLNCELLKQLSRRNIPIQVLVNNTQNYDIMLKLMRDQEDLESGIYYQSAHLLEKWTIYRKAHSNVNVRISKRPILHSVIQFEASTTDVTPICVGFYQYSNHNRSAYFFVGTDDIYGKNFITEFSYLWENESQPIYY